MPDSRKEAFEAWYYTMETYCIKAGRPVILFDDAEAIFDGGWQADTERAASICNLAMPQPVKNWCDAQIVEALRKCVDSIRDGK